MRRRHLLSATALLAPAGAATAQPASNWRATFPTVGFGILSVESQGATVTRFSEFPAYFRAKLGVDCRIFQATDYAGVVQALTGGQIPMARLGPASYASAWIDSNGAVEPLVTWYAPTGQAGYYSVLIVRSDSPFQKLEDLRGKTLAWADPNSTSGYLVPLAALRSQNIDPARYFSRTVFSGGHEQSVLGVLNGNFDAAFTWTADDCQCQSPSHQPPQTCGAEGLRHARTPCPYVLVSAHRAASAPIILCRNRPQSWSIRDTVTTSRISKALTSS